MQIRLHVFAGLAESLGCSTILLELSGSDCRVKELKEQFAMKYPGTGSAVYQAIVSVDRKFATDTVPLAEGCEVALLPPVSGG